MSLNVTSAADIPKAKYYVTATDRFMSGWGLAQRMTNKMVLPCDDYATAVTCAKYLEGRSEMKYVNIRSSKPPTKRGVLYSVSYDMVKTALRQED